DVPVLAPQRECTPERDRFLGEIGQVVKEVDEADDDAEQSDDEYGPRPGRDRSQARTERGSRVTVAVTRSIGLSTVGRAPTSLRHAPILHATAAEDGRGERPVRTSRGARGSRSRTRSARPPRRRAPAACP